MSKGHNKETERKADTPGNHQNRHLKAQQHDHDPNQGRRADKDPAKGKKGANSI